MISVESETLVQCCRCNNQHNFADRIEKPMKGRLMRKIVCPRCNCESYVVPIILTSKEKYILKHMLGIKHVRRLPRTFSRNSFFASEGHPDLPVLQSLIEKKLVDSGVSAPEIYGPDNKHFWVTEIGTQKIRKEKILR